MLEMRNVSKTYKDIQALKNVNLILENGVYALLGPNGAGKSTLMNSLCCQMKIEGDILWNERDIRSIKNEYYQILGYAPQQQGLYDEFSGLRFLTYMALLKGINKSDIRQEVQRVAKIVNMTPYLSKKCKTYSGGMKQRLLVAQALIGNPKIILLDEPTAGLDPRERVSLREVFRRLGQDRILLIATHVVSDVENIANQVIFLRQGEIVNKGTVDELLEIYHKDKLEDVYVEIQGETYDFEI